MLTVKANLTLHGGPPRFSERLLPRSLFFPFLTLLLLSKGQEEENNEDVESKKQVSRRNLSISENYLLLYSLLQIVIHRLIVSTLIRSLCMIHKVY